MIERLDRTTVELSALQSGKEKLIEATLPSSLLVEDESELSFQGDIKVKGKIYLAGDALIFQFSASVAYQLPCKVCNTPVISELEVKDIMHAEDIEELTNSRFDYSFAIREALLLEIPDVIECKEGRCPEREHIQKYLKEERKEDEKTEMSYHPFSSL